MTALPRRKHTAVMREYLPMLEGTRAADLGCGDGALVRFMTREGARVIGARAFRGSSLKPGPGRRTAAGDE